MCLRISCVRGLWACAQSACDALGHFLVCRNLRRDFLAVGDTLHEDTPSLGFFGMGLGLIPEARAVGLTRLTAAFWLYDSLRAKRRDRGGADALLTPRSKHTSC